MCLLGVVALVDDYGITWDEYVHAGYGNRVVDYFASGFEDRSYRTWFDLRYYGVTFDAIADLATRTFGADPYFARHVCSALCAVLAVAGVMLLARRWRDPWLPLFAALCLVMLPRFFGHAFNNGKDIAFASAFTFTMVALFRLGLARRVSWGDVALVGAGIGLTASVRNGGIILLPFAAAAAVLGAVRRHGLDDFSWLRGWPGILGQSAGLVLVSWAVMIVGWPWAHESPIANPIAAFGFQTDFPHDMRMLFRGEKISSLDMPRSYLAHYLKVTTPLPLLVLAGTGVVRAVLSLRSYREPQAFAGAMVLLWLGLPLLAFAITTPAAYDGIRHFLFLLPAIAILAGLGAVWLRSLTPPGTVRGVATVMLLLFILLPARDLTSLHPYQTSYFNELAGGVAKASESYETDYWLSSYREAAAWINARAAEVPERRLLVLVAGNILTRPCLAHFLGPGIEVRQVPKIGVGTEFPPFADYYVATTRRGFDRNYPDAAVVHEVGRDGAVFTVIKTGEGRVGE